MSLLMQFSLFLQGWVYLSMHNGFLCMLVDSLCCRFTVKMIMTGSWRHKGKLLLSSGQSVRNIRLPATISTCPYNLVINVTL